MRKKIKPPKISDKEAADLTRAAVAAFGNKAVDDFMDEVFREARAQAKRRQAREARKAQRDGQTP